jgi:cancer susceptibility candidate protein 1
MRNVYSVDDRLRNIPYPDPNTQIQADPIAIALTLPEYIFICENDEIKVGVWDEKDKVWQSDLIDDLQLDKSSRKLEFTTRKLAQMAYLQSRCTDYPYKKWKLRCVENEQAILDIETKRLTLTFEIGPDYLMLLERNDPELKDLVNKKLQPGVLLLELSKCGLHLMPADEDA